MDSIPPAVPAPSLVAAAPSAAIQGSVPSTPPADLAQAAVDSALVKPVAGATTAEAELSVPVYRTRLAPAATLQYELRRGFLSGSGELVWRPGPDRYETRLEGSVAGISVITQVSSGLLDANGIAPNRFTDQRLRRAPNAANFQRDKRKITYSGPQVEFPLVPGAQDRLSWMLQIGAVLNAEPQRAAPGGRISFFITGARGDADVWTFGYIGTDELRSDNGPVRAVKFTRLPRRPYDSLVEIWLAPERHHLPVRARLTADGSNEVFELLLRDMRFP
jgi:hypothetical protein